MSESAQAAEDREILIRNRTVSVMLELREEVEKHRINCNHCFRTIFGFNREALISVAALSIRLLTESENLRESAQSADSEKSFAESCASTDIIIAGDDPDEYRG